jgi:hypothetical protein
LADDESTRDSRNGKDEERNYMKNIYTDRRGAIETLLADSKYKLIAEVIKDGRLIAGLFTLEEEKR